MTHLPDFIIKPRQLIEDPEIQPLDGDVFGLIYWFTKLRLERCLLRNKQLADLLHSSEGSIKNSISRLIGRGYVKSFYDRSAHTRELVVTISFDSTSSNDDQHVIKKLPGTSSNDASKQPQIRTPNKRSIKRELNNNIGKPKNDKSSKKVDNHVDNSTKQTWTPVYNLLTNPPVNKNKNYKSILLEGIRVSFKRTQEQQVLPVENIVSREQAYANDVVIMLDLPHDKYFARIANSLKNKNVSTIKNALQKTLEKKSSILNTYESRARYFFKLIHTGIT